MKWLERTLDWITSQFDRGRPNEIPFRPKDLNYGLSFCQCGAQLAYVPHMALATYKAGSKKPPESIHWRAWDCSAILLGVAVPKGEPGSVQHDDLKPFVFWSIKPDRSEHPGHLPVWSIHGTAPDPFLSQRKETPS